jgi:hypothetical protein
MNALSFADLSLSQDLNREALATIIGGAGYELISKSKESGPWSGYSWTYITGYYNQQGQLYKSKWKATRTRTQTETSYWNYYYF